MDAQLLFTLKEGYLEVSFELKNTIVNIEIFDRKKNDSILLELSKDELKTFVSNMEKAWQHYFSGE